MQTGATLSLFLLLCLGCSSNSNPPGNPPTPPSTNFTASPLSLPALQSLAPQPPQGASMPTPSTPSPKTIQEAFGPAGALFPVGFEGVSLDWTAPDLIQHRPWVSNEGNLAPYLSYMYREAGYGVVTGQQKNQWLIDNKVFGVVEYHFQRDPKGAPVGPLYKVVFIFEVSLPKEAVEQIRVAGSAQWGELKTSKDDFGLEFNQWSTPTADIRFYYSPTGAIPESIEIIHKDLPAIQP